MAKPSEKPSEEELLIDKELVARAQEGEIEAFDTLVLKYNKRLYAMVYHMTQDRDDTYDLLQDIFAKAYRSIKKFKGKSAFYTWIYSIGVNMTINHLKKKKRKATYSLDDENLGIHNDHAIIDQSARSNPRKEVDLRILQNKLNKALMNLSEQHRAVVTLFDMQGLPHAEISKILKVSEGTVRSRLFYAHRSLQSQLEEFKNQIS